MSYFAAGVERARFAGFHRVSTGFCHPIVTRTLQRYAGALGGRLEIRAIFDDDHHVKLTA
jgi:hypothetical protein